MRSAAADEGIALLKQGCKVLKYNRHHKAALTAFTLSEDEHTLFWEGHGVGGLMSKLGGKRRSVELADVYAHSSNDPGLMQCLTRVLAAAAGSRCWLVTSQSSSRTRTRLSSAMRTWR